MADSNLRLEDLVPEIKEVLIQKYRSTGQIRDNLSIKINMDIK